MGGEMLQDLDQCVLLHVGKEWGGFGLITFS